MNLLSRFRNFFRRAEDDYEDYSGVAVAEADETQSEFDQGSHDGVSTLRSGRTLRVPQGSSSSKESGIRTLQIPLAPILAEFPLELQGRVIMPEVGDISVLLSLELLLPQLSKGVVTVAFGELRRSAPQVFTHQKDQDATQVKIPLSVVLPRLSPEMLARKHARRQVQVPDEIVSPFADKGQGLAIASVSPKPAVPKPATPKPAAPPLPRVAPTASRHTTPPIAPSRPDAPATPRQVFTVPRQMPTSPFAPRQSAPASVPAAPSTPAKVPATPSAPIKLAIPPSAPVKMSVPQDAPIRMPSSVPANRSSAPAAQSPDPVAPQPVPVSSVASANGNGTGTFLKVSVSAVADAWPDALKHEIVQLGLAEGEVSLPFEQAEAGLKRGRLAFNWKTIRGWITQGRLTGVSIHDATELELPLRVVAPLFIKHQKETGQEKPKVAVDKDIPNLFYGMAQPEPTGQAVDHSVTRPVDTNYYVWDDSNDSVAEEVGANNKSAGTEFVSRYATPNEVVSRASAIEGVEGALIALPDGLMVANSLPEGHNGDTLAAFLPHLFGKVTQCTQELRMGELNNLNFTVGNVPWKIFRVNALYFAAFGRKGEPLPTAQLAALAGELNHKVKS